MKYRVSINPQKDSDMAIEVIYEGDDYQSAFDKAVGARGLVKWRGKWIRFEHVTKTVKWAEII